MHLRELDANLIVILDALLLEASVTKAAERLGRSPSAVSHALARLREIFDDPLFVRAGQRLVPTSRATQIAPTVHIIVSGLEGLLHRQNLFDPGQQQRAFTIGCRDVCELSLLPGFRSTLSELAPGITLARQVGLTSSVVEGLRSGQIDLALVEGPVAAEASDISVEKLLDDPLVLLAPPGHALSGSVVRRRNLSAQSAIVVSDAAHAEMAFGATGATRPAGLRTVSSPLIAVHTALASGALVLAPESIADVAAHHAGLARLETELSLPAVPVQLMWHVSQERDECHSWLRDMLRWKTGAADEGLGNIPPLP